MASHLGASSTYSVGQPLRSLTPRTPTISSPSQFRHSPPGPHTVLPLRPMQPQAFKLSTSLFGLPSDARKNCDKQLAVLLQIQVLTSVRNSAVAQRPFLVFSVGSLSRLLSGCCKLSLFFPSSRPLTSPSYSADHSASD